MAWAKGNGNAPYRFTANVTGNGTLTVTANGSVLGTYTSADGAQALRFSSTLASSALSFSYEPGDDDTGGVELSGFSNVVGTVISFR